MAEEEKTIEISGPEFNATATKGINDLKRSTDTAALRNLVMFGSTRETKNLVANILDNDNDTEVAKSVNDYSWNSFTQHRNLAIILTALLQRFAAGTDQGRKALAKRLLRTTVKAADGRELNLVLALLLGDGPTIRKLLSTAPARDLFVASFGIDQSTYNNSILPAYGKITSWTFISRKAIDAVAKILSDITKVDYSEYMEEINEREKLLSAEKKNKSWGLEKDEREAYRGVMDQLVQLTKSPDSSHVAMGLKWLINWTYKMQINPGHDLENADQLLKSPMTPALVLKAIETNLYNSGKTIGYGHLGLDRIELPAAAKRLKEAYDDGKIPSTYKMTSRLEKLLRGELPPEEYQDKRVLPITEHENVDIQELYRPALHDLVTLANNANLDADNPAEGVASSLIQGLLGTHHTSDVERTVSGIISGTVFNGGPSKFLYHLEISLVKDEKLEDKKSVAELIMSIYDKTNITKPPVNYKPYSNFISLLSESSGATSTSAVVGESQRARKAREEGEKEFERLDAEIAEELKSYNEALTKINGYTNNVRCVREAAKDLRTFVNTTLAAFCNIRDLTKVKNVGESLRSARVKPSFFFRHLEICIKQGVANMITDEARKYAAADELWDAVFDGCTGIGPWKTFTENPKNLPSDFEHDAGFMKWHQEHHKK